LRNLKKGGTVPFADSGGRKRGPGARKKKFEKKFTDEKGEKALQKGDKVRCL